MRNILAVCALALLAGCGQSKSNQEAAAPAPAAAPVVAPITTPAWAASLDNQPFAAAFPSVVQCKGYVDGAVDRRSNGASIVGWSWNDAAKAGYAQIVMVDAAGKMVGFGEGGVARPDVPTADKAITRPDVGWSGKIAQTTGTYTVYGIDTAAKSACKLGEARL